ncbi:hypothetical protein N7467_012285 [Penicillium canescens]|nr:hypothetical protein N7467_012285 [Penicillium canescens]
MEDRQIAFISGPIDTGLNESYFHTHYVTKINDAIQRDHDFVIGPLPSGVDAEALAYLLAYPISPERITIFVTQAEDGMWGGHFRSMGVNLEVVEGQMTRDRDAALTRASTYDILRVRTKDEAREFYGRMWREAHITNTERNWKRRRGIAENEIVEELEINRSMGCFSDPPAPVKEKGCLARWVHEVFQG